MNGKSCFTDSESRYLYISCSPACIHRNAPKVSDSLPHTTHTDIIAEQLNHAPISGRGLTRLRSCVLHARTRALHYDRSDLHLWFCLCSGILQIQCPTSCDPHHTLDTDEMPLGGNETIGIVGLDVFAALNDVVLTCCRQRLGRSSSLTRSFSDSLIHLLLPMTLVPSSFLALLEQTSLSPPQHDF